METDMSDTENTAPKAAENTTAPADATETADDVNPYAELIAAVKAAVKQKADVIAMYEKLGIQVDDGNVLLAAVGEAITRAEQALAEAVDADLEDKDDAELLDMASTAAAEAAVKDMTAAEIKAYAIGVIAAEWQCEEHDADDVKQMARAAYIAGFTPRRGRKPGTGTGKRHKGLCKWIIKADEVSSVTIGTTLLPAVNGQFNRETARFILRKEHSDEAAAGIHDKSTFLRDIKSVCADKSIPLSQTLTSGETRIYVAAD